MYVLQKSGTVFPVCFSTVFSRSSHRLHPSQQQTARGRTTHPLLLAAKFLRNLLFEAPGEKIFLFCCLTIFEKLDFSVQVWFVKVTVQYSYSLESYRQDVVA